MPAQHPMVAQVEPGSPADKAGLKPERHHHSGSTASRPTRLEVDGRIREEIIPPPAYTLDVEREGRHHSPPLHPAGRHGPGRRSPDSPAAAGGIKAGDVITAVDGKPMPDGAGDQRLHPRTRQPAASSSPCGTARATRRFTITPAGARSTTRSRASASSGTDEFGIVEDAYGKFQVLHPGPVEQVRSEHDVHLQHRRRDRLAEERRQAPAHGRPGHDDARLLHVLPEPRRLAARPLVQRGPQREPRPDQSAADPRARRRPHHARHHRGHPAPARQRPLPGSRPDELRRGDHRFYALHRLL